MSMFETKQRRGIEGDSGVGAKRARTLAIVALAVAALWILVVPGLNHILKYDDPIESGERLSVAPGITFAPPTGWNLEAGLRAGEKTRTNVPSADATLSLGPISATVKSAPAAEDETPQNLIDQIEHTSVQFDKATLSATGETLKLPVDGWKTPGLAEHYAAPSGEGAVAAFVIDGTEVVVKVIGPPAQMYDAGEEIGEMLASFSYEKSEATKPKAGSK